MKPTSRRWVLKSRNPWSVYATGDDAERVALCWSEANARLIAAAPELLEAAILILEAGPGETTSINMLQLAITKAEGK